MKYKVVCVRDITADLFAQPAFVANIGSAVRGFGDEVKREDANNMLNKHPDDFELYYLGEYNDADGSFDLGRPERIAVGKDYV